MKLAQLSNYIEKSYNHFGGLKDRFTSFEWLKVYLEETVQIEDLDLVGAFFSQVFSTSVPFRKIYKEECVRAMTQILCTLLNDQKSSKSLSKLLIETNKTDEQDLTLSTLTSFLIPDLINIAIDYSFKTRFEVEMYIDILDTSDIWDIAKIKQIFQYKNSTYLSVHYLEWTDKYDEIITTNSSRIRLLYDDNNQIVYNWATVDKHKITQVDYRERGESKWRRCSIAQAYGYHKVSVAPAGTFLKSNCQ